MVKSRPRQKLPTQSRKAHLLETPPSPPPPRLQLMAAAEQCYDWYPSRSRPAAPPPGLSSSPQGSESDPWSWSWTWRSWPTRWPFTLSRGGSSPHLPGSPSSPPRAFLSRPPFHPPHPRFAPGGSTAAAVVGFRVPFFRQSRDRELGRAAASYSLRPVPAGGVGRAMDGEP